jgi:hypothetical protein
VSFDSRNNPRIVPVPRSGVSGPPEDADKKRNWQILLISLQFENGRAIADLISLIN